MSFDLDRLSPQGRKYYFDYIKENKETLIQKFGDAEINKLIATIDKKVVADFKRAYKAQSWFSFFGNNRRSKMGIMVFNNALDNMKEVEEYLENNKNGASIRAMDWLDGKEIQGHAASPKSTKAA